MAPFAPWLGVFETLRVIDGTPLFVEEHLAEMHRAADALGFAVKLDLAAEVKNLAGQSGRWRWLATPEESRTLFTSEAMPDGEAVALGISTVRVGSQNWDARFKTFSYLAHAQALAVGGAPEMVLLNERGEVASAARGNIFWRRGERLFTPAHEVGCREGVMRGFVLSLGPVQVGRFPLDELVGAEEIFFTNSLRGIVSINALEGAPLHDFSFAEVARREYHRAVRERLAA